MLNIALRSPGHSLALSPPCQSRPTTQGSPSLPHVPCSLLGQRKGLRPENSQGVGRGKGGRRGRTSLPGPGWRHQGRPGLAWKPWTPTGKAEAASLSPGARDAPLLDRDQGVDEEVRHKMLSREQGEQAGSEAAGAGRAPEKARVSTGAVGEGATGRWGRQRAGISGLAGLQEDAGRGG